MVDIVNTSVDVQHLLPAHWQLIAHAVSKTLGLGQAEIKENISVKCEKLILSALPQK